MKYYSSAEVIRMLENKGWYEIACVCDHHQFKHPIISGRITVPHPKKDLSKGTTNSILKQAQILKEGK